MVACIGSWGRDAGRHFAQLLLALCGCASLTLSLSPLLPPSLITPIVCTMSDVDYSKLEATLRAHGQEHVLGFWPQLSAAQQAEFAAELMDVDYEELGRAFTKAMGEHALWRREAAGGGGKGTEGTERERGLSLVSVR